MNTSSLETTIDNAWEQRDSIDVNTKGEMRDAVDTMISWQPERIIIAHGRWYEGNAVAELRRAFRWLPGIAG